MSQVETLPQSIVDTRTVVLKPRLDQGDIQLIGEKIKPNLFARFGFKPKPRDIRLLCAESYFEPYLIIGGRYTLDYCRRHVFEVNVSESITKVFIAGQEFRSEQSDPKVTNKVIKMTGEEQAHYERQAYFILDRMKREISPERLPLSPFDIREEKPEPSPNFKTIQISDEEQIEFLKAKIAKRPADVAEIIREIFDITDRAVAYYPMYQLTFENTKNHTDAVVAINGITGEITLNGHKKLAVKTIVTSDETVQAIPSEQTTAQEIQQPRAILNISPTEIKENVPAEEQPIEPTSPETIAYEEEPETQTALNIDLPETNETIETAPEEKPIEPAQPLETAYEEPTTETVSTISSVEPEESTENAPAKEQPGEPTTIDAKETMILGFPAKILGEIVSLGKSMIAIVGDVEIPSGSNINKTLVVKGSLRIGDNCRVRGKLKALKSITVGADTIVDGDVVSGGNVFVGLRSLVKGSVQAAGVFEIEENAVVEGIGIQTAPSA